MAVQKMQSYNKIYLPYSPPANWNNKTVAASSFQQIEPVAKRKKVVDVDYIYIFYLYLLAVRPREEKIKTLWRDAYAVKQMVNYSTIRDLQGQINELQETLKDKLYNIAEEAEKMQPISYATVQRMLNNELYNRYFTIDRQETNNILILNNDFSKSSNSNKDFVVLNPKTYLFLIKQQDNLLAKYTIYLKKMCGIGNGKTDFTADQFLTAYGYSTNSHSIKNTISQYNHLLEGQGIIRIDSRITDKGTRRNTYTFIDTDATPAKPSIGLACKDKPIGGFVF